MENTAITFSRKSFVKFKKREDLEKIEIIKNLESLRNLLNETERELNFVTDELIIDSLIYQNLSLKKRYDYYLRLCKDKGIVANGFDKIS